MGSVGILVVLAAFLSAFFGIFTVNLILVDLFQREREETLKRLNEELLAQQRQKAREQTVTSGKDPLSEIIAEADREAERRKGILERIEELTMQSGLRITTTKLLTICVSTGVLVSFFAFGLSRNLLLAGAVGGAVAAVPLLYVSLCAPQKA